MKKILIVDDSVKWVEYHIEAIRLLDSFIIDTAYSAKAGVAKIEVNIDEPYDIILTDMQMESDFLPTYAGEWFIRQIRTFKQYDNTKIVIISATSDIKNVAERNNVLYLPKYLCTDLKRYAIIKEL
ncbi:MAG: response regulator [Cyanobacteria bacterium SIG30]|nr:response regulator [Cyanobacteria bacterium SIG30]